MPSGPSERASSPAAARIPAWRIPPPTNLRPRRARPITSCPPTSTEPTGQPRPFDRQNVTVSAGPDRSVARTPWATTAFQNRAPSTCSGTPWACAIPATRRVYSGVSGWPIEWAWVFSMVTRPLIGSCGSFGSRKAASMASRSIVPSGLSSRDRMLVPTMTAWPAASSMTR